jgi:pimeloyl-ACP methyl ester carboxylesterase
MLDLVLIHAFPFDRRLWDPQRERLSRVATLHTPDLRGFGDDRAPPATSIDAMADAVRAWLDAKQLTRFVLGGLSMGGYVTLAYARRHAGERPPHALVLADTKADADGPDARLAREDTARLVLAEGLGAYADRMLPKLLSPRAPPSVVAEARRLIEAQRPQTVAAAALAMRDRPDATALLRTLALPVLVLAGEEDVLTPPAAMAGLANALPNATFARIPGAGHLANLEQPATFDDALQRFLARLE